MTSAAELADRADWGLAWPPSAPRAPETSVLEVTMATATPEIGAHLRQLCEETGAIHYLPDAQGQYEWITHAIANSWQWVWMAYHEGQPAGLLLFESVPDNAWAVPIVILLYIRPKMPQVVRHRLIATLLTWAEGRGIHKIQCCTRPDIKDSVYIRMAGDFGLASRGQRWAGEKTSSIIRWTREA